MHVIKKIYLIQDGAKKSPFRICFPYKMSHFFSLSVTRGSVAPIEIALRRPLSQARAPYLQALAQILRRAWEH
jgi:hypothetical protein